MAERTLPFVNVAMWSGGYYSTATKGAKDVIDSLFHLVHGLTPIPTYLDEIEDVYVLAAATSFYRPILPAGTLNLGFSATAMHWLCRKPFRLMSSLYRWVPPPEPLSFGLGDGQVNVDIVHAVAYGVLTH